MSADGWFMWAVAGLDVGESDGVVAAGGGDCTNSLQVTSLGVVTTVWIP